MKFKIGQHVLEPECYSRDQGEQGCLVTREMQKKTFSFLFIWLSLTAFSRLVSELFKKEHCIYKNIVHESDKKELEDSLTS